MLRRFTCITIYFSLWLGLIISKGEIFMDLKKEVKEIIKWAQESEENKKKAINMATSLIALMNSDKKLSEEDIKKMTGGSSPLLYE